MTPENTVRGDAGAPPDHPVAASPGAAADAALRGHVVVVDDAESDRFFLTRAFGRVAPHVTIECHGDVHAAIGALDDAPRTRSSIIIVDVNMPGDDGLTLLAWARSNLPTVPVVMLSGSAQPADRAAAYRMGAAGFFTKPMGTGELDAMVEAIATYWFRFARLWGDDVGPT